jgi:hypothetical protein
MLNPGSFELMRRIAPLGNLAPSTPVDLETLVTVLRSKVAIRDSDDLLDRMRDPALKSCPVRSPEQEDLLAHGQSLLKADAGAEGTSKRR